MEFTNEGTNGGEGIEYLPRDALRLAAHQTLKSGHKAEVRDGGTFRSGDPSRRGFLCKLLEVSQVLWEHNIIQTFADRSHCRLIKTLKAKALYI